MPEHILPVLRLADAGDSRSREQPRDRSIEVSWSSDRDMELWVVSRELARGLGAMTRSGAAELERL